MQALDELLTGVPRALDFFFSDAFPPWVPLQVSSSRITHQSFYPSAHFPLPCENHIDNRNLISALRIHLKPDSVRCGLTHFSELPGKVVNTAQLGFLLYLLFFYYFYILFFIFLF